MPKYMVVRDEEGNVTAHGMSYSVRDGEEQVGEVEADSVDAATKKAKRQKLGSEEPEQSSEEAEEDALQTAREEEEAKEDFVVMADGDGNLYVEGDEDSDPSKQKKGAAAKKSEPPPKPEPTEVGTFRAKDASEALAKAKGEYADPAAGPQRGAQTP